MQQSALRPCAARFARGGPCAGSHRLANFTYPRRLQVPPLATLRLLRPPSHAARRASAGAHITRAPPAPSVSSQDVCRLPGCAACRPIAPYRTPHLCIWAAAALSALPCNAETFSGWLRHAKWDRKQELLDAKPMWCTAARTACCSAQRRLRNDQATVQPGTAAVHKLQAGPPLIAALPRVCLRMRSLACEAQPGQRAARYASARARRR